MIFLSMEKQSYLVGTITKRHAKLVSSEPKLEIDLSIKYMYIKKWFQCVHAHYSLGYQNCI